MHEIYSDIETEQINEGEKTILPVVEFKVINILEKIAIWQHSQ